MFCDSKLPYSCGQGSTDPNVDIDIMSERSKTGDLHLKRGGWGRVALARFYSRPRVIRALGPAPGCGGSFATTCKRYYTASLAAGPTLHLPGDSIAVAEPIVDRADGLAVGVGQHV